MKLSRTLAFAIPVVLVGTQLAAREMRVPTAPVMTDATMMIGLRYDGGPVVWSLGVNNPTPGPLPNVKVDFAAPGAGLQQQAISLAQGQTERVKFTDPSGINLCGSKDVAFSLGTDLDSPVLRMRATSVCEFLPSSGPNYWLQAPNADVAQAAWLNHALVATIKSASLQAGPSRCGGAKGIYADLLADVHNNTQKAGHGLLVQLKDQSGTVVGTSVPFSLAKGTVATIAVGLDQPTKSRVEAVLVDPQGSLGNASVLSNPGVYANILPSCTTSQTRL